MFTEQQIKQIRKSLGDWLLYKVITDNKGLIPDVDNFIAFLEKGAIIKEGQKQIVNTVSETVRVASVLEHTNNQQTRVILSDKVIDVMQDPMEGMVCDSCQ